MIPKIFQITGSRVKTEIELALIEVEAEIEAFVNRANIEVLKLQNTNGITQDAAIATVLGQIETNQDFAKAFFNKVDSITAEIGKQAVARPVREFAKQDSGQLFEWHLGSVKSVHCPDCLRESGKDARTITEWLKDGVGLPREGLTACNVGCRCMLLPRSG